MWINLASVVYHSFAKQPPTLIINCGKPLAVTNNNNLNQKYDISKRIIMSWDQVGLRFVSIQERKYISAFLERYWLLSGILITTLSVPSSFAFVLLNLEKYLSALISLKGKWSIPIRLEKMISLKLDLSAHFTSHLGHPASSFLLCL